jgi:beta-galactosidase
LHCNIVRTSHYPQSRHFLDRCDEIGLLVLEEIPGWQHIGDESWKQVAIDNVGRMIRRDWNHPSIVLWGVRINESPDDHNFYTRTNALAHALDDSRQTGGIRNFPESEFLEDVFTVNDFGFPLRSPNHPRYLNTEFVSQPSPQDHR